VKNKHGLWSDYSLHSNKQSIRHKRSINRQSRGRNMRRRKNQSSFQLMSRAGRWSKSRWNKGRLSRNRQNQQRQKPRRSRNRRNLSLLNRSRQPSSRAG
jgi:hypothetical protein